MLYFTALAAVAAAITRVYGRSYAVAVVAHFIAQQLLLPMLMVIMMLMLQFLRSWSFLSLG